LQTKFNLGFLFGFSDKTQIKGEQKKYKMNETSNEQKLMRHATTHKGQINFEPSKIPTGSGGYKKGT